MSLPSLQLDDLRWAGMVEAIRNRIAANSDGEWTMHGPLDPGVTLLELFAYQFEQRIYWLDQLSEPLERSLLALLDDTPRTTAPARTMLAFRMPDGSTGSHLVPANTVFRPRDRDLPLRLTTLEDATVLPVSYENDHPRIDLTAFGEDRSADLRAGRAIPLMPADRSPGELTMVLWLERQLKPEELNSRFSLYLDLHTSEKILPEWAAVPDEVRWFDRGTQAGYSRASRNPGDLIPNHCRLETAEVGSGLAGPAPTPSNAPPIWINDFVADGWSREHLLAEPPSQLTWRYSTGPVSRAEFADDQLLDGTGGLRRPGLVRIRIPSDWQPLEAPGGGLFGYALYLSCDSCTWSAPPRLRRLLPNTALAHEVQKVVMEWASLKEQLDRWLRLPGQELHLDPNSPEPLEESICLTFLEPGGDNGEWHDWHVTDDFYHHGPADRVFVVDRPRKRLVFGNGLTGRIPVLHGGTNPTAELHYLAAAGDAGNIGRLAWASRDPGIDVHAENPIQGRDGAAGESLAEARARVGRSLSRRERAVTEDDFKGLAENTPGVAIARAHAAVGFHPCFPCHPVNGAVTVFLVPDAPREDHLFESGNVVLAPVTDPGAIAEVVRRLDTRRLLTAEVYVRSVRYRAVRLQVELQGIVAGEDRLKADLEQHLTRHLDPLVGGESGEGWLFGESLRPSGLIKQIQERIDSGIAVKRVAIALDGNGDFEDCHDVEIGPHELVYLKDLTVTIKRHPATGGGLR